jgi:hypothetical protein
MSALSLHPSRLALPGGTRALRLELKRNAVPLLLPLLAAVFYFDTLRTADAIPAVWTLRASVIGNHMLFDFSAFAGGLAAWAGSREGRRKTLDLVATTPRAAWARLSVTLAGTLCWLLVAFLTAVGIVYVKTALEAAWGGRPAADAGRGCLRPRPARCVDRAGDAHGRDRARAVRRAGPGRRDPPSDPGWRPPRGAAHPAGPGRRSRCASARRSAPTCTRWRRR